MPWIFSPYGENIQGNLVQGQDYLLGITNTNLRTTPLNQLAFIDSSHSWDDGNVVDQLTVENISERVTHVETCVQPHWMFFTTAGQLQKEQLGVTAANDACDTIRIVSQASFAAVTPSCSFCNCPAVVKNIQCGCTQVSTWVTRSEIFSTVSWSTTLPSSQLWLLSINASWFKGVVLRFVLVMPNK